jgi:hypothetical protein
MAAAAVSFLQKPIIIRGERGQPLYPRPTGQLVATAAAIQPKISFFFEGST